MEEQVLIHLLEANKELPAREEIVERFKADYSDRLEAALTTPEPAVGGARDSFKPAVRSETVKLRQDENSGAEAARQDDAWQFAEETNATGFHAPEEGPVSAGDERNDEPLADETAGAFDDVGAEDLSKLEAQQEAASVATDALLGEVAGAMPDEGRAAAFIADASAQDDMMPVPEELTRPELPEGDKVSDGSKKKKKKRR